MHCIPYHALQHCHICKGNHAHWQGPHKHHHHHHGAYLGSDKSSPNGRCNRHVSRTSYYAHRHQHQVNTHISPSCSWSEVGFYSIPKCSHHVHDCDEDPGDHWTKTHGRNGCEKCIDDTLKKRTDCRKASHDCRQHEGQCYLWRESDKNNLRQKYGNCHGNNSYGKPRKFDSRRGYECAKNHRFGCADNHDFNLVPTNKKINYRDLVLLMTCRLRQNPDEMHIVAYSHGQKHVHWSQPLMEMNDGATLCCNETSDTGPNPRCDCGKERDKNRKSNCRHEENSEQYEMSAEEGVGHEHSEDQPSATEGTTCEESTTTYSEQDGDRCSTNKDEGPSSKDGNINNENDDPVSSDTPESRKLSQTEAKMDCD